VGVGGGKRGTNRKESGVVSNLPKVRRNKRSSGPVIAISKSGGKLGGEFDEARAQPGTTERFAFKKKKQKKDEGIQVPHAKVRCGSREGKKSNGSPRNSDQR